MQVLLDLAREITKDPEFGPLIVDEPEMLGADAFAESAVVITLIVRMRPLKQWAVERELLRRIKNRFDELGTETPSRTAPCTTGAPTDRSRRRSPASPAGHGADARTSSRVPA